MHLSSGCIFFAMVYPENKKKTYNAMCYFKYRLLNQYFMTLTKVYVDIYC
jgi:hypothetical protein